MHETSAPLRTSARSCKLLHVPQSPTAYHGITERAKSDCRCTMPAVACKVRPTPSVGGTLIPDRDCEVISLALQGTHADSHVCLSLLPAMINFLQRWVYRFCL